MIVATRRNLPIAGVLLVGLLFLNPVLSAGAHLVKPRTVEEIEPVMKFLREHQRSGDILYLYYGAWHAFKYYSKRYDFTDSRYVLGISSRDDRNKYVRDLGQLHGNRRVWILFSHVYKDEEALLSYYLDTNGTRLDSFRSEGAAVYLYDLDSGELREGG